MSLRRDEISSIDSSLIQRVVDGRTNLVFDWLGHHGRRTASCSAKWVEVGRARAAEFGVEVLVRRPADGSKRRFDRDGATLVGSIESARRDIHRRLGQSRVRLGPTPRFGVPVEEK